ncbi:hypothetical protein ILUMI_15232, partial [Ignelater luminosus]
MFNLLSYNDYKCIGLTDKLLQKCYKKIIQLDKSNVPVVGSAMIPLVNKNNETKLLEFIVVNVECPPILGLQASIDLSLITYHINMVSDSEPLINKYTDAIKHEFKDLFDGKLGSIPGTASITLDSNAKPVAQPARRIPFGLIDDVKAELARMVTDGVIEPITKPTKWDRPLETLFKRPLNKVPPRLQRMTLAVQSFDLHVVYKPGKELFIADALSRAFVDEPVEKEFYTLNEKSNGQSESAVKIVKNIFKKCQLTRDDPWLGLMKYRNTPKEHMPSPAQLLYSRNLRTRIP